jgi:HPt (histidine-containing phosphotransfer) domain-containing protein
MSEPSLSFPQACTSFDRTVLLERCMGNASLAEKLISVLLVSLPRDKSALQTAIDDGDLARTASVAHRLRGAASNVGANPLSEAAKQLEQSAKATSSISDVQERWQTLAKHIDGLIQILAMQDGKGSQ